MGRHSSASRSRQATPALALALVLVGGGGLTYFVRAHSDDTTSPAAAADGPSHSSDVPVTPAGDGKGCPDGPEVTVTTTPDLAPTLTAVAARLEARGGSSCARYRITPSASGLTAQNLVDGKPVSGIWIPDSPMWLDVVNRKTKSSMQYKDTVATSPIGLAVPAGVTGGPTSGTWGQLLKSRTAGLAMADPRFSTSSLLTLLSMRNAAAGSDAADVIQAGIVGAAANARDEVELAQLASTGAENALAYPASEQQMVQERASGSHKVTPVTTTENPYSLEYGVVALPGSASSPAVPQAVVDALSAELASDAGKADLAKAGFRVPGQDPSGDQALLQKPTSPAAPPSAADQEYTLDEWAAVRKKMRMLVAIDVSGSMKEPATAGMSRIQLASGMAKRALQVLPDDTEMGVWAFSTNRGPKGEPWAELAPIRALGDYVKTKSTQRNELNAVADKFVQMPNGGTNFYDTVDAAVKKVQSTYDPSHVNSVVVWTDGINQDAPSMSKEKLITLLKAEAASTQPVRLILVGMGDKADMKVLTELAAASGGGAYDAKDPKAIDSIIAGALTARLQNPR